MADKKRLGGMRYMFIKLSNYDLRDILMRRFNLQGDEWYGNYFDFEIEDTTNGKKLVISIYDDTVGINEPEDVVNNEGV